MLSSNKNERYCYLTYQRLEDCLGEERVLDALVERLEVPGKRATLKLLSRDEKLDAIFRQVENFIGSKTSRWYQVPKLEVLAAAIFDSDLPKRHVLQLFSDQKTEAALCPPVTRYLAAKGYSVYDEVPMGTKRADVVGLKEGGWFSSVEAVAVELKNELSQLSRGLDQMTTFAEHSNKVYLACTPSLAAQYLQKHAEGRSTKGWDPTVLRKKLDHFGFGLLLVEGDEVTEVQQPRSRANQRLDELVMALKTRRRIA